MKSQRSSFTPAMKMADLLDSSVNIPGVFNRMGLQYGFGDASVEETCRKAGIDPGAFLLICKAYALDGYRPSREEMEEADLNDVVKYLRLSHKYYLESALKTLGDSLEAMSHPCDERSRSLLRKFFGDYREELSRHFAYEEENVFPYVESFLSGGPDCRFTADEFTDTHESAEEKLEDLKSLVVKYMPASCDQRQAQLSVFYLYTLGKDIEKHIILEDTILAPMLAPRDRSLLESRRESDPATEDPLSAREKEILVCVAKGMLNKEIADQLNLSIYTVITHRKNITRKTGIKTVAGLTVYALLNNLIDMNSVE